MNEIKIGEIWAAYHTTPRKIKNPIRPFLVLHIDKNNYVYGIPLTSFKTAKQNYYPENGDLLINNNNLELTSVIKPYDFIKKKRKYFRSKITEIENKLLIKIENIIQSNIYEYLANKNIHNLLLDEKKFILKSNLKIIQADLNDLKFGFLELSKLYLKLKCQNEYQKIEK